MTMTPIIKIDNFYLKREDLNQTGSAKDRAIQEQIKEIKKRELSHAVLSSTGNAAISAAHFCQKNNIKLTVFLSPKVDPNKVKILQQYSCQIEYSQKAISDAIKYAQEKSAYLLRQSTDPQALVGYQQIAQEIKKQLPQTTSIFIPVGSGTTLLGISQQLPKNIKIFAVQSASNCPLAKRIDSNYQPEDKLITDALSAKYLPKKEEIIKVIKDSQGSALVVQNKNIIKANKNLEKNNIQTSMEGALALAGLNKAIKNNIEIGDCPLILLTGAKR